MSLSLGNTSIGSIYLGPTKVGEAYIGGTKVYASVDPYNPLRLPPYTIRLKFTDGVTPTFSKGTAVQVSSSPNVWDLTYNNTDWKNLNSQHTDIVEVLGANSTGVTNMTYMFNYCTSIATVPLFDTRSVSDMSYMFNNCSSLTAVPLFNTSNVKDMTYMFNYCTLLTTVPLFDTSIVSNMSGMFRKCTSIATAPLFDTRSVTSMTSMFSDCSSLTAVPLFNTNGAPTMNSMFYGCSAVQSGALALYQQVSTQAITPGHNTSTFKNCGINTVTGAAELAQIPSSWGGTGT